MFRKNLFIILFVFVLALIGYYLLCKKMSQATQMAIPSYIEDVSASMWQPFQAENGSFQVLFPMPPKHASVKDKPANGAIVYNIYSTNTSDGTQYAINSADYPQSFDLADSTHLLQTVLDALAKSTPQNRLMGQVDLTIQGYAAIDFDLQNAQYATLGRAIVAEKTLYVLTVKNRDRKSLEKNFRAFVDSFQISAAGS